MSKTFEDVWTEVDAYLSEAKAIAFDGCHKIYILMDHAQVHQSAGYGYGEDGSFLITKQTLNDKEMLALIKTWYNDSCGLKFVQAIESVPDSEDEFTSIIPQGYEAEFCYNCGEFGADFDQTCDNCREDEEDEDEDEDEDEE